MDRIGSPAAAVWKIRFLILALIDVAEEMIFRAFDVIGCHKFIRPSVDMIAHVEMNVRAFEVSGCCSVILALINEAAEITFRAFVNIGCLVLALILVLVDEAAKMTVLAFEVMIIRCDPRWILRCWTSPGFLTPKVVRGLPPLPCAPIITSQGAPGLDNNTVSPRCADTADSEVVLKPGHLTPEIVRVLPHSPSTPVLTSQGAPDLESKTVTPRCADTTDSEVGLKPGPLTPEVVRGLLPEAPCTPVLVFGAQGAPSLSLESRKRSRYPETTAAILSTEVFVPVGEQQKSVQGKELKYCAPHARASKVRSIHFEHLNPNAESYIPLSPPLSSVLDRLARGLKLKEDVLELTRFSSEAKELTRTSALTYSKEELMQWAPGEELCAPGTESAPPGCIVSQCRKLLVGTRGDDEPSKAKHNERLAPIAEILQDEGIHRYPRSRNNLKATSGNDSATSGLWRRIERPIPTCPRYSISAPNSDVLNARWQATRTISSYTSRGPRRNSDSRLSAFHQKLHSPRYVTE